MRQAIEETGYYPNSIARSLKADSTFSIGFIVSNISNKYFMDMAKYIEDVIGNQNYNLIVCSTEGNMERELAYLKTLVSKRIDGLISGP